MVNWEDYTSGSTPNAGRSWWGWGTIAGFQKYRKHEKDDYLIIPPTVKDVVIREPRIKISNLSGRLKQICSDDKFERLLHSKGRDMLDIVDNVHGKVENPIDLIAFPETEQDIQAVLQYCSEHNVACVIWGGGSSVVQGVNPPADDLGFMATISLDMMKFDKVLEIDEESMTCKVQGGVYGPALERQLKKSGLTLRYFPQSFEFSTVGGWAATRGGGHFATGPTHIDDLVESVRIVTPTGITETRRLPASGAGPSEYRIYVGSEGIYGIITEVWLKLRRRPVYRTNATILFTGSNSRDALMKGSKCIRDITQAQMYPANLRIVDGVEVENMTGIRDAGLGKAAMLLVGFESDRKKDLGLDLNFVLDICEKHGGVVSGGRSSTKTKSSAGGERSGLAGEWGKGFMAGGYTFSEAVCAGVLLNTFETAITWDKFPAFYKEVNERADSVIKQIIGGQNVPWSFTCRFTHVYQDGPAPYFTIAIGKPGSPFVTDKNKDTRKEQWMLIKKAVTEVMIKHGATSTHHHAVGRLHRPHYEVERGESFEAILGAMKNVHDPKWILNPEILIKYKSKL